METAHDVMDSCLQFLIKYKNCLIDISMRKLIYQLENTIDVEKIGEIVNAK